MGRSRVLCWGTIVVLCLGTGCRTTQGWNPLARTEPSVSSEQAGPDAPGDNPFKSASEKADARSESPTDRIAEADGANAKSGQDTSGEKSAQDDAEVASHDAETLKLIKRELQDAPPKERERLYNDLKGLDPGLVRLILRNRRMVRNMGQEGAGGSSKSKIAASDVSTAAENAGQSEPGSKRFPGIGHSGDKVSSSAETARAGLGAANPWANRGGLPQRPAESAERHTSDRMAQSGGSNGDRRVRPAGGAESSGNAARSPVSISQSDFRALQQETGTDTSQTRQPEGRSAQSGSSGMTPRRIARRSTPRTQGTRQAGSTAQSKSGKPQKSSGFPWPSANPFGGGWPGDKGNSQGNRSGKQTNQGTSGPADGPPGFDRTLQRLVSLAEADVAEIEPGDDAEQQQRYIEKHVDLRLLYLIAGRQERALEAIPGIEPADQEFWQQMFWSMTNYFDDEAIPDEAERAAQTVAQLRSALMRLKEKARLGLRNVTFCHKISSYGNYEEFDRNEFSPGQPVLLYAEVDNFKSERTSEGKYRTILKSTIEVYKAGPQGDLVHREEFPATEDLCRNQRRDYFHSYEFTIPERISLGPHVLKLTVEDQLSRKVATYTVKFQVK